MPTTWKRYEDAKSRRPYYYNIVTKETTWEIPEEVAKSGQAKELAIKQFLKGTKWRLAQRDGRPYYYDIETKKTQWEMPDILNEFVEKFDEEEAGGFKRKLGDESEEGQQKIARVGEEIGDGDADFGVDDDEDDDNNDGDDNKRDEVAANEMMEETLVADVRGESADSLKQHHVAKLDADGDFDCLQGAEAARNVTGEQHMQQAMEVSENKSSRVGQADATEKEADLDLETVTKRLERADALMNSDIQESARRYFQLTQDGAGIVQKLSDGYVGYASMSRVLMEWLTFAKVLKKASSSKNGTSISSNNNTKTDDTISISVEEAETIDKEATAKLTNILARLVKQRFSKEHADQLFLSSKPAWLEGLLTNKRYRTMLMELYNSHSDSTFTGVCLREISSRGYHSEISEIVKKSDIFEVFQNIIKDIISRALWPVNRELDDDELIRGLRKELKRSCCGSDDAFSYTTTILERIEKKLNTEEIRKNAMPVILRLQRLRDELEMAAVWSQKGYDAFAYNSDDVHSRTLLMNPSQAFHGLDAKAMFALKLIGTFVLPPQLPSETPGSDGLSPLLRLKGSFAELLNLLKNSRATASNLERLCVFFYSLPAANTLSSADGLSNDSVEHLQDLGHKIHKLPANEHPVDAAHHERCGHLLRHPQVMRILVNAALGKPQSGAPSKAEAYTFADAIRLLALAQPFDAKLSSGQSMLIEKTTAAANRLEEFTALLRNAMAQALQGNFSYELMEEVTSQVQKSSRPGASSDGGGGGEGEGDRVTILAKIALQWMSLAFGEFKALNSGSSSFLKLLPAFFALMVTIAEWHPSLHPHIFYLVALVLNTNSDDLIPESMGEMSASGGLKLSQENITSEGGEYTGILAHKDAVEVMVQLMGWGFTLAPMSYLTKKVDSFDAALVRHIVTVLTNSIVGPGHVVIDAIHLSKPFAVALSEFLSVDRVKNAMASAYLDADIAKAALALKDRAHAVVTGQGGQSPGQDGQESADSIRMDIEELF